jgi:FOG: Ankyrin repeat
MFKSRYHFPAFSVQLSHYSVREFLILERICRGPASYFAIKEPEAHLAIARCCLTYLLSFDRPVISDNFHPSTYSSTSLDDSLDPSYPLLEYAAFEWHTHVQLLPSEYQSQTEPMILRLLDQDNLAFHHWLPIYRSGEDENSFGSPLCHATELGLSSMVRMFLDTDADVNSGGGMFGSAFAGATLEGHTEVVRILLEHGADVNIRGGLFHTPLQAACVKKRLDVFNLLLGHGADINITGGYYGCAPQAAAARGWPAAALHLIKSGADVTIMAGQFGTGLQAASRYGHEELVMGLLVRGANPNAAGGYYNAALETAARGGHNWNYSHVVGTRSKRAHGEGILR